MVAVGHVRHRAVAVGRQLRPADDDAAEGGLDVQHDAAGAVEDEDANGFHLQNGASVSRTIDNIKHCLTSSRLTASCVTERRTVLVLPAPLVRTSPRSTSNTGLPIAGRFVPFLALLDDLSPHGLKRRMMRIFSSRSAATASRVLTDTTV